MSSSETLSVREIRFRLAELRLRVAGRLRIGLRASGQRIGLCRDLAVPLEPPAAQIPISVRPLRPADLPVLLPHDGSDIVERANCRAMAAECPGAAFVAVDARTGTPCFVQWLFGASDNAYVARLGGFPRLASDEALIEHAYVAPAWRGMGIMPAAMARVAEHAAARGARSVLAFVGEDDVGALRRCQRAGFQPHLVHRQEQHAFGLIRRHSFTVMDADDPRRRRQY